MAGVPDDQPSKYRCPFRESHNCGCTSFAAPAGAVLFLPRRMLHCNSNGPPPIGCAVRCCGASITPTYGVQLVACEVAGLLPPVRTARAMIHGPSSHGQDEQPCTCRVLLAHIRHLLTHWDGSPPRGGRPVKILHLTVFFPFDTATVRPDSSAASVLLLPALHARQAVGIVRAMSCPLALNRLVRYPLPVGPRRVRPSKPPLHPLAARLTSASGSSEPCPAALAWPRATSG